MAENNDYLARYIENRYKKAIDYYWQASRNNKEPINYPALVP